TYVEIAVVLFALCIGIILQKLSRRLPGPTRKSLFLKDGVFHFLFGKTIQNAARLLDRACKWYPLK
ncbi:hypothetical protein VJI72_08010, partial [Parvimonas micra]|uniref:hypothetical protein n=1 Tax=Parvimonas micra TaxID=33033 RepID=UPI002B461BAF